MFAFTSSLDKTKFDLIVIVQSYPNLITAINYLLSRSDKKSLVLVNGDRKIYKFLTKVIKNPRVEIKLYGNNIFLRSRFFSWALCWYVLYLQFRIPKFSCDEELITFGNWCDIGALFHNKVNNLKLTNLIAVEEERYTIKSDRRKEFPLFINMINFFTNNLIERKHYFYEEDGEIKQIEKDNFGLDPSQIVAKSIMAPRERSYHLIDFDFKDSTLPFILYVEKNLLKSK